MPGGTREIVRPQERVVREQDDAAMIHREQTVFHRREHGLKPGLLPGRRGELLLNAEGGLIQDPGDLAELVVTVFADSPGQIAPRQRVGSFEEVLHRRGQRPRQPPGEAARQEQHGEQRDDQGAPELVSPHFDPGQRQRRSGHPEEPPLMADVNRDVHLPLPRGGRESFVRSLSQGQSVAHFRPGPVVLDRAQSLARCGGVPEHHALEAHDRQPRLGRMARPVHQFIDPGTRPLHAPRAGQRFREEPGLGPQPLLGFGAGVDVHRPALNQQNHQQRDRAG